MLDFIGRISGQEENVDIPAIFLEAVRGLSAKELTALESDIALNENTGMLRGQALQIVRASQPKQDGRIEARHVRPRMI